MSAARFKSAKSVVADLLARGCEVYTLESGSGERALKPGDRAGDGGYSVWSPAGHALCGTGCHVDNRVDAADLIEAANAGNLDFEPCTNAECDTCHPESEVQS